ncbi:MAG: FmdB family zinc ribbon protein [Thermodesulfobacteriota bacterium]
MPIFEFRCPACGHEFECLVMGQDWASELRCPRCSRPGVEKLLSVFASAHAPSDSSVGSAGSGCGSSRTGFS